MYTKCDAISLEWKFKPLNFACIKNIKKYVDMKKMYFLLIMLVSSLCCVNAHDEVELKQNRKGNGGELSQRAIPVDVDIDRSLLGIHFRDRVKDVNVSVSGPDGVVYNEWFTTPAARSVQVDLSPCQDGRYEILFFDAEGNEAEGSFLKEE